jgi:hypothetical protein
MQVINILGAEVKPVAQPVLDCGERQVCRIRLCCEGIAATHGIEPPNQFGIGMPGFRGCDLVDPVAVPQAPGPAESSKPTLR